MKTLTLTILFSVLSLLLYAQKTKLVVKDKADFYEEYEVLANDKKIKHGYYTFFTKNFGDLTIKTFFGEVGNYVNGIKEGYWESYYPNTNQIQMKGFYKNNQRDSLWTFFYQEPGIKQIEVVETPNGSSVEIIDLNTKVSKSGYYKSNRPIGLWNYYNTGKELIQQYDFDTKSIIYDLNNKDLKNIDALYVGGEYFMYTDLNSFFDFKDLMKKVGTKIALQKSSIKLSFKIDKNGNITNINVIENSINNKKFLTRAIKSLESTNGNWSPKYRNGIAEETIRSIRFQLDVEANRSSFFNEKMTIFRLRKEFYFSIVAE